MEKTKSVYYVRHPVAAEQVDRIRAAGYKVVDSAFMPADYLNPPLEADAGGEPPALVDGNAGQQAGKTATRRGRPPKG